MKRSEIFEKIRDHLLVAKSCALMMANAQSAAGRNEYLKRLSEHLKDALSLMVKLEESDQKQ